MEHPVFVYGTLKRGFPNHVHLAGARLVGDAVTVCAFPLIVQGQFFSPALIPEPGSGHRIAGELWQVDPTKLAELDRLESVGLPTGYIRDTIEVETGAPPLRQAAWTYFKPRARISLVQSAPLANYQDRRYVPAWKRQ